MSEALTFTDPKTGHEVLQLTSNVRRAIHGYYDLPPWSPTDGSGLKRIGEFGNHPLWHPNGREILTNSPFKKNTRNMLVLTDVHTGKQRLAATCVKGFGHPSFSPEGKHILIDVVDNKTRTARFECVHVETDTSRTLIETTVTDHSHAGTHLHPVWRQDGSQILYASDASGISQLCVLNFNS